MTFDEVINIILEKEGGLVNNPKDPGGLTNFGIAQKYYPNVDIKNLTRDQAKVIYKTDYYDKVHGDQLPEMVRLAVVDCAVNQGVSVAVKILQKLVGTVCDGHLGPETFRAINLYDPTKLLFDFMAARRAKYYVTKHYDVFGKGWMNRLEDIEKRSV
jgi:lysozyme family protein